MKTRGVPELIALAESQGFRVKRTRKGVAVYGKQPEDGMALVHLTCSDHRAMKNAKAGLRRIGVRFE